MHRTKLRIEGRTATFSNVILENGPTPKGAMTQGTNGHALTRMHHFVKWNTKSSVRNSKLMMRSLMHPKKTKI